jgi:DNA polymerase-3 subunit chi
MPERCQIDFYLLARPGLDARRMACRLALMAWERGHRVIVATGDDNEASAMNELMWESPAQRFLPHEIVAGESPATAPVVISPLSRISAESLAEKSHLNAFRVIINLCPQPVPEPVHFERLLEIVPHEDSAREASREKYKYYRSHGITPGTHEINK